MFGPQEDRFTIVGCVHGDIHTHRKTLLFSGSFIVTYNICQLVELEDAEPGRTYQVGISTTIDNGQVIVNCSQLVDEVDVSPNNTGVNMATSLYHLDTCLHVFIC